MNIIVFEIVINSIGNGEKESFHQLIIVGRLVAFKGHKYLLDALPLVRQNYPTCSLWIVGDGPEKKNLLEQVEQNGLTNVVSFMGFQPDPYRYIQNSDIIILPSLFEPFGLVYIESFALKTPVIAFDTPAGNEIIEHNQTGLLVEKYNSKELAQRIVYLLDNPDERKRLSQNAYNQYINYYTIERMAKETADWYKEVCP